MGWSIGYDSNWDRYIGYSVPAFCDHPKCNARIDRGLAYVCCDQQPYGGERGCGLFFCYEHQSVDGRCPKCRRYDHKPYKPKPEHPDWMRWMLRDELDRLQELASPGLWRVITVAVETGMRASEIASRPEVRGRVAYLLDSKNATSREVPLSAAALEAWRGGITMKAGSISAMFAQFCKDAKIKGLTFHDLRRTAIVRLADKLKPMELAKMVGHKDLRVTLNTYYRSDPEEVAKKL